MPIYVNKENNPKREKAVKVFTDRLEPREVFWRKYKNAEECMNQKELAPVQIISYYGIGGVGKTSLLKEIQKEIIEKEKNAKYCYIDFEKLLKVKEDVLGILNAIKAELKRNYKFEFPLFDLAAYEYNIRIGVEANRPELMSILGNNKELNFLVSLMEEIPLVGTFAKLFSLVDEGSNVIRSRFKDHKLKDTFKQLDTLDLEKLKEILPFYFAKDLEENLKNEIKPFVFQFDTYERIVNELTSLDTGSIDNWLKDETFGLITNVSNVLWVIAGREKLKWEEENPNWHGTLEQHLLGDLSYQDSCSFLKHAGIIDEEIIKQIYEITSGIPMYLDMCVDTYYKSMEQNQKFQIEDFKGDKRKLIERFFTYMNDQEKDFVTVLAFIGNWTDQNIENKVKSVLGNFSFNLYEKIKNFSFVIQEKDQYKIHEAIRLVIQEEAPSIIKQKFEEASYKQQEEKRKEIEQITTIKDLENPHFQEKKENIITKEIHFEETSVLYLEKLKKEKYKQIIDEAVAKIEEFLYQQPKWNKDTKKEYCEKVTNLITLLEEYLKIYDGKYETAKLKPLIQSQTFKRTYEYKKLHGLYIALYRYENLFSYYSLYTGKDTIHIFHKTEKLYKKRNDRVRQILYILRILGDPRYTIDTSNEKNNEKIKNHKTYFTSDELNFYREVLKKYHFQNQDQELIILLYTMRKIKEFDATFQNYFANIKNPLKEPIEVQRFLVRYTLAMIYEEFKGRPGSGYIFKEYNQRKQAEASYQQDQIEFVKKEDKEKYIQEYMASHKKVFLDKYLGFVIDSLQNEKRLIDEITLEMFLKVGDAIYDEETSDHLKIKIFHTLLGFQADIFYTNDPHLIQSYHNLILSLAHVHHTFHNDFIKTNETEITKIKTKSLQFIEDFQEKQKELYGKSSPLLLEEEYNQKAELLIHYHDFAKVIEVYNNIKEKNAKNQKALNTIETNCLKEIDHLTSSDQQLYEFLWENLQPKLRNYFENYVTISLLERENAHFCFQKLFQLALLLGTTSNHSDDYLKFLEFCQKYSQNIKNFAFYQLFSWMLLTTASSQMISQHNFTIINPTLEFYYKIFSKTKDLFYQTTSTIYSEKMYRESLIALASLLLIKIFYYDYFPSKEKDHILEEKSSKYPEVYTYLCHDFQSKTLNDFYYQMIEKKKITYTETNYNIKIDYQMFQNGKKSLKEQEEYLLTDALFSSSIGFEGAMNEADDFISAKKKHFFHRSKIENTYEQYLVILSLINKMNFDDPLTNQEIKKILDQI